ncbi:MAG TPA: phosphatase PAP2 family protein [Gemmatimonadaceae bacterium]|nr:phosphatase PAP2 family protein [Gemmatimonadaceae bacterium]
MADRILEPLVNGPTVSYVAFISTALFAMLTALVVANETMVLDRELILSLRETASPVLTTLLLAVTFTSGRLAVPAAIVFAAALYRRSGFRTAAYYVGACVSAQALNAILKVGVDRSRPHDVSPRLTAAGGLAYPSADAMLAVVIFGLGTLLLSATIRDPRIRFAMVCASALFVIAAATARVYLGAHWPTDVLGGMLAGLACAAICIVALRRPPVVTAPVPLAVREI